MFGVDDAAIGAVGEVVSEAASEVASNVYSGVESVSESSLSEEFSADSFEFPSNSFDISAGETTDVDADSKILGTAAPAMEAKEVGMLKSEELHTLGMKDANLEHNSIEEEFSPEMFSDKIQDNKSAQNIELGTFSPDNIELVDDNIPKTEIDNLEIQPSNTLNEVAAEDNNTNPIENSKDVKGNTIDAFENESKNIESSESAEKDDSPRKIKTINDSLEGQKHPDTGVPYERKIVETDTGEKVEGVFPQFESEFDVQLPEELEKATDKKQFDECNRQLKEKCDSDPSFKSKFTPDQQADIDAGRTPDGYTWHHNEEKGKMQLVNSDTHWDTRHTGGRNIWGGGSDNRR